jgi:peptidoglycan/xylan/chitin deacetylase (PgdA/CDA1 family)
MVRKKTKKKVKCFLENNFKKVFLVCFAIIVLAFSYRFFSINKTSSASFVNHSRKTSVNYYTDARISYFSPTPTIAPTLTPTPTLTPKEAATYIPPTGGFCLTVPVLMYHHIQPEVQAKELGQTNLTVDNGIFDQQMEYLSSHGYTTLSADQLINALRTHAELPSKSILITFDDGYKDIVDFAFPVLQKYNIIGNVMIPTGLINNNGFLLWDDLRNMVGSGRVFAYDHTWSHASLTGASNEKIQTEVSTAKTQLEQNLGRPVSIFAYPYGSENQRVVDILSQDGFTGAFSTIPGWIQCDSFIMTLHRNRIGNAPLSSYGF